MGTLLTYKTSQLGTSARNAVAVSNFGVPYFFTSASLNVLLTLMIVIRLSLHGRKFRNSMDAPTRSNGPYKAIITILIQSSALYAVAILLFIGPWSVSVYIDDVFFPLLAEIRVCTLFLRATILGNSCLIVVAYRSSRPSSSSYESPTGEH